MELKLEPDDPEVLTNGEDPAALEEIIPTEHDHHSSSEVSDPHEETGKDLFAPDHSISSEKFPNSKDCLEKLECLGKSATPTPASADREMTEENADIKNEDAKVSQTIDVVLVMIFGNGNNGVCDDYDHYNNIINNNLIKLYSKKWLAFSYLKKQLFLVVFKEDFEI